MTRERLLIFEDVNELGEIILEHGGIDATQWHVAKDGRTGLQVLFDEIKMKQESNLFVVEGRLLRRIQTTAAGVLYQEMRLAEKDAGFTSRAKLIQAGVGVMGKVPNNVSSFEQLKVEVFEEMGPVEADSGFRVRLEDGQVVSEGENSLDFTSETYSGLVCQNLFHFYRVRLTPEQYLPQGYFHKTSKGDRRFLVWGQNKFGDLGVNQEILLDRPKIW